jgi:hypothetical protein
VGSLTWDKEFRVAILVSRQGRLWVMDPADSANGSCSIMRMRVATEVDLRNEGAGLDIDRRLRIGVVVLGLPASRNDEDASKMCWQNSGMSKIQ